jgi:hypothetical protein
MSAPQYVHKNLNDVDRYSASIFRAVQFHVTLPQSHWHVNCGHPKIDLLKDLFWVQTRTGPVEIGDGQWVVLSGSDGLSVLDAEAFSNTFEPLSDYE